MLYSENNIHNLQRVWFFWSGKCCRGVEMSSKPAESNPSGFPLLWCSTNCPQTCTAQQGIGKIQVLSLPLAPGGRWLSISDNHLWKQKSNLRSILLPHSPGKEPGRQTPYQLAGQRQGGHERPEHCRQGPDGAVLAVVQTGAWHWAFPGSLMEEMRGNPQNRTDWQVRTVSYRKQVGVVHGKESMHRFCWEVQPRGSYNQNTAASLLTLRPSPLLPAWVGSHLRHLIWCIVSGSALSLKTDRQAQRQLLSK